jgi:RNA recognition motif-containing protein
MPFWYTEDQIRECWGECGEIEHLTMLRFPDSGNFRGIAFITFATQEAYEAALQFNGDELEGKYLVVKPCRPAGGNTNVASRQESSDVRTSDLHTATARKLSAAAPSTKHAGRAPNKGTYTSASYCPPCPTVVVFASCLCVV